MKIVLAKNNGFCFGVNNAVELALKSASPSTYSYGEIIHNEHVIEKLKSKGVRVIESLDDISKGTVIIRSHGIPKLDFDKMKDKGLTIIDATCPYVKKIHDIVSEYSAKGYTIVILGKPTHPEVIGINGWCNNSAIIIEDESELFKIKEREKVCVVAQTTFSKDKYETIIEKIRKLEVKMLELFSTICYTTYKRQTEAFELSQMCDCMIVIGSENSSNTRKLYDISKENCNKTFFADNIERLGDYDFVGCKSLGIIAGASTPNELIEEVVSYMSKNVGENSSEFLDELENSLKEYSYKEGKRVRGKILEATDDGVKVNIGGKKDGFIPASETSLTEEYNKEEFRPDEEIDVIITKTKDDGTGCVLLSKKAVDRMKEGDKIVETIRDGSAFELTPNKATSGGLLGKLGTYTVFIPASHVKERFVKDIKPFVNKKMRLSIIEIDDEKHKIVASAKNILEKERKEKEEEFWAAIQPNMIVSGKVKRMTDFGAFVNVGGFDCLAHITDLSWNRIKSVDEVLKLNQDYEFLVLSADREKNKVSLGYKQLQPHPFVQIAEKYPVGTEIIGKVVRLEKFGAFVEIEPKVDGLVHISEASNEFVKNISDVLKVGEEVKAKVLKVDTDSKKITLSIKACLPEGEKSEFSDNERTEGNKEQRPKREERRESTQQWNEENKNNPFAELLKDVDIKE